MNTRSQNNLALAEQKYLNKRVGRLLIIKICPYEFTDKHPTRKVECLCDCGNMKRVCLWDLTRKDGRHINSCGCFKREKTLERCLENLISKRFGKLLVLEYAGQHPRTGAQWKCICDTCISKATRLKNGTKKSCGCYQKSSGSEHWNWNPNIPIEDKLTKRGTVKNLLYENWRSAVYERDQYTCQVTGKIGGDIVAHHLFSWCDNPTLRFDVNNGITLSKEIHLKFHKRYGKGKNTKEQFEEFLKEHKQTPQQN
jgi:5-methylcytosine-specific restriction endonuclease McrA